MCGDTALYFDEKVQLLSWNKSTLTINNTRRSALQLHVYCQLRVETGPEAIRWLYASDPSVRADCRTAAQSQRHHYLCYRILVGVIPDEMKHGNVA